MHYDPRMTYVEFPPPNSLAAAVRCIWHYEANACASAAPERIVPDGRCELIVHFAAPYLEGCVAQPRVLFAGQLTRPLWLVAGGDAGVVGVRFHPAGARRFLSAPLYEATDRRICLVQRWPEETARLLEDLAAAATVEARTRVAARFVVARMERSPEVDDELAVRCVRSIEKLNGAVSVDELASAAGIGRRQLERRFRDAVGVPPRLFAGILRFRRVFDAMQQDGRVSWTEAAAAAGYFDQSHLIRDCRRFLGCTPAQFLESRGPLAGALVQPDVAFVQSNGRARR
jgi:AraC-like DNA-binding protein